MAAGDTFKVYAGDGVTSDFPIPFPYDTASTEVSVTRANGAVTYTFTNPALIHLTSPTVLAVGDTLTIKRITDTDNAKATFKNGSGTTGAQLNGVVTQLLRAVQEIKDTLLKVIVVGNDNTLDAQNLRIKNVANATNANDAVNKSQLDAAVVAAGNVPTPGAGNVGKYLKATTAAVWAWTSLVASDISNATAAGIALLTGADATAQRTSLGLGSLATKSTVVSSDITDGTIVAADLAANTLTFAKFQRSGTAGQVWASTGTGSDPVYVGGMTLISSGSVSSAATLDLALPSGYKRFVLYLDDFVPATNSVGFYLRYSFDNGSTYKATAADYYWTMTYSNTSGTGGYYDSSAGVTNAINVGASTAISNASTSVNSYIVDLWPAAVSKRVSTLIHGSQQATATFVNSMESASSIYNGPLTNIRLLFSSGNIATGTYALYGVS